MEYERSLAMIICVHKKFYMRIWVVFCLMFITAIVTHKQTLASFERGMGLTLRQFRLETQVPKNFNPWRQTPSKDFVAMGSKCFSWERLPYGNRTCSGFSLHIPWARKCMEWDVGQADSVGCSLPPTAPIIFGDKL